MMNERAYVTEILRTYAGSEKQLDKLCLGALGLAGETGEIVDAVKKAMYQGHALDRVDLCQELGDVLWYFMLVCHALDLSLDEVMRGNVEKLHRRYPSGFESARSIHREEGRPL